MILSKEYLWRERLEALPPAKALTPYARGELASENADSASVIAGSVEAWTIYCVRTPILAVGLIAGPTLLAEKFVWMLAYEALAAKHLRKLSALLQKTLLTHPNLVTAVRNDHEAGHRFARFLGFLPQEQYELFRHNYTVYRKRL